MARQQSSSAGGRKSSRKTKPPAGENSTRTNAAETIRRGDRNRQIYTDWLAGKSFEAIAAEHDLSQRSAERIVDELRAVNWQVRAAPLTGLRTVDRLIDQFEASISELADLQAQALKDKNLPVALGCLRAKNATRMEWLALLQARGLVPRNLSELAVQADAVQLVARIVDALDRHGVPDEVAEEVAQAIEMDVRRAEDGHLELDMGEVVQGEVVD